MNELIELLNKEFQNSAIILTGNGTIKIEACQYGVWVAVNSTIKLATESPKEEIFRLKEGLSFYDNS